MNIEKVLDIAVQADPSTVEVLGEVGGRAFIAGNGIRPQFIQKFAELIVKECCSAADGWYQNHNGIHWDPAQHIRNHFGVE